MRFGYVTPLSVEYEMFSRRFEFGSWASPRVKVIGCGVAPVHRSPPFGESTVTDGAVGRPVSGPSLKSDPWLVSAQDEFLWISLPRAGALASVMIVFPGSHVSAPPVEALNSTRSTTTSEPPKGLSAPVGFSNTSLTASPPFVRYVVERKSPKTRCPEPRIPERENTRGPTNELSVSVSKK